MSCERLSKGSQIETINEAARVDSFFVSIDSIAMGDVRRQKAIENFKTSLRAEEDLAKRMRSLDKMTDYLYSHQDTTSYLSTELEVQELSLKIGDSTILANSISKVANYYRMLHILDKSFEQFYKSAGVYESLGKEYEAGLAWLSMAILQKRAKDYAGSEASSIKALKFLTADENSKTTEQGIRYIASTYNNLGTITKERDQYDISIDYYEKALIYRKQIDTTGVLESATYNNIGLVYLKKGDYEIASSYYEKGLANKGLLKLSPKSYARLLDNLAFALHKAGKSEDVEQLFFRAIKLREEQKDISGLGVSNYHLARYYFDQKDYERSEEFALKALDYLKQADVNTFVLETLELLAKIPTVQTPLAYTSEYIQLSKVLEKKERSYQDKFARVRYESEELMSVNKRVTRNFKQLTIAFLCTVVLFLLGYIWRQRINRKREENYLREQQKATEEIYNLMLAQKVKVEEGKQQEKTRISEELHDHVISKLFGIRMSLDSFHTKNDEEVVKSRKKYLKDLKDVTKEIRQISHDLHRNDFLKNQIFTDLLDDLVKTFSVQYHIEIALFFDQSIDWDRLADAPKAHLYRIIQEALTNAHKHGEASRVEVRFILEDKDLVLIIQDNGKGIDLKRMKPGIGLKNIESRTLQISGVFKIVKREPKGTIIEVRLPIKNT